ncbi:MAG: type II toxin-antitoxin system RelE/ParE family toxin [Pseudohongiella sp.]|nr:type II toxin-antitoxin system RelE/ParE family toxin [Pseudohongiella sp.]MDO9519000.1 type II toxin-antitoxin system RelE/ParE family toxin [Pseudohongiella sp.]MDP2128892.1 type II toxin-antitoxin system RelE/ParE family toxin [Pseudohongiella sp.]
MIFWEQQALEDRRKIYEYLYAFNPLVADKTDEIIEDRAGNLVTHPLMGLQRSNTQGRILVIPEVSMIVSYYVDGELIRILRVLHQKQQFPA